MDIILRVVYSGMTLYMLMILLSWFSSWLGLDMDSRPWSVCRKLTKPLVDSVQRLLPPMGPINLSPLVAVLAVWFCRVLLVRILTGMAMQAGQV